MDAVEQLAQEAQSTVNYKLDKWRLTDLVVDHDHVFIGWIKGYVDVEGNFVERSKDNITLRDTSAEVDDEGNVMEPASNLYSQFMATSQVQAVAVLIRQQLKARGLV